MGADENPALARQRHSRRFEPLPEWAGPSTRLIHGARRPELNAGAIALPIYQTSTFRFPAEHSEAAAGGAVHFYTRMDNPTQEAAAELVRGLEGAEAARVFGSGMGALTTTLLALARQGDEVVALDSLYGGTLDLLRTLAPKFGIRVRWVSAAESQHPQKALSSRTKLVFLESPTNPLLTVHDLSGWAQAADAVGAITIVDNTFATPINQRPLALGADLVVHSGTKYLGGHSDLIAGVAAGPRNLIERIDGVHAIVGAALDPFAAFLLTRGMRTLAVRVARQNENARIVAEALVDHPKVERVCYPGWGSEREESIARRQMTGRGGMLSVTIPGGRSGAARFLKALRFLHVASSLGGVESLASMPSDTSHRQLGPDELKALGIDEGLVRVSVGIEDSADLVRDLTEALDRV